MPTLNINGNIRTNTTAGWTADATVYTAKTILVTTDATYGATDQRKFKIADGTQTWAQLDYFPVSGYDDATSSTQTQLDAKNRTYSPIHTSTTITHTGTVSETIIYNTSPNLVGILQSTDRLDLQAIINASNNANTKTFSWYISNSQTSLSGQVLIGRHSVGAGWATSVALQSFLKMKNSLTANSYRDNSVSSLNMNNMYTSALPSINNAGAIDFSSGSKYLIITVQLANSADTINVYSVTSNIFRP